MLTHQHYACRLVNMQSTAAAPRKTRTAHARKCRECQIYYVPGSSHCDCGASMFRTLDRVVLGAS